MASRITYEELAAIGDITVHWNSVEEALERVVWTIAKWEPAMGKLVTADLGNVSRVQLALNLANYYLEPILVSEVKAFAELFDFCRISRNDIIHGLPNDDLPDGAPRHLVKATAKAGIGAVKQTETVLDGHALRVVCHDQLLLLLALTALIAKVRDYHRYLERVAAGSTEPFDHTEYYDPEKGSLHGIVDLQTRLKQQRLQRQQQGNNRRQP